MMQFANLVRPSRLLAAVLITLNALLLTGCRSNKPFSAPSMIVEAPALSLPQLEAHNLSLSIPLSSFDDLSAGHVAVSCDTASHMFARAWLESDSLLHFEATSFQVAPFHIGGFRTEVYSPPQPVEGSLDWSKLFLWFGVAICFVILLRK